MVNNVDKYYTANAEEPTKPDEYATSSLRSYVQNLEKHSTPRSELLSGIYKDYDQFKLIDEGAFGVIF